MEEDHKERLITSCHQVLARAALAEAALLPFAKALSGKKEVAAHLTGLVTVPVPSKAIWRCRRDDGLPLPKATH